MISLLSRAGLRKNICRRIHACIPDRSKLGLISPPLLGAFDSQARPISGDGIGLTVCPGRASLSLPVLLWAVRRDRVLDSLAQKISALPTLNKAELLRIWAENFQTPPPRKLRRELMVPILAYRMQEREFGGLSHAARRRLREIAISTRLKPRGRTTEADIQEGTKLVRSWKGETHEVRVLSESFEYRGQTFGSLSEIARTITGTRWSGPASFGTRGKTK
jgi:hypothetical protein